MEYLKIKSLSKIGKVPAEVLELFLEKLNLLKLNKNISIRLPEVDINLTNYSS